MERVLASLDEQEPEWWMLYKRVWVSVAGDFAGDVFGTLKAGSGSSEIKAPQDTVDVWALEAEDYVLNNCGNKIRGILDTTKERVRATLTEGMADGEGIDNLALRLNRQYAQFSIGRANNIARTEVGGASNYGSRMGALSTTLPLEHEWLTAIDGNERESHAAANGQRVPMNQPFIVDGESLMFPGDTSMGATGGNIINCRCAEVYHVVK